MAMLLGRVKEDAEAFAEEPITDVVLTVPPFWAQDERQALLDAAGLSKLNVLGLMNENTVREGQRGGRERGREREGGA